MLKDASFEYGINDYQQWLSADFDFTTAINICQIIQPSYCICMS